MDKLFYSDKKGNYKLMDYNPSHSELLFRKYKSKDNEYNIDIMFKGVISLNIITAYKGIEIFACDNEHGQTCKDWDFSEFIFKIIDDLGTTTFINSAAFGVFKNKLDFSTTSLGDFTWSKDNEIILWSHDDDEFKNKIG